MSIESAKAFYVRMTEDDAFRAPFERESTSEERRQLIADAGYEFTAEEWQAAMTASDYEGELKELKEEELEAIAGGAAIAIYGGVMDPTSSHIDIWLDQK